MIYLNSFCGWLIYYHACRTCCALLITESANIRVTCLLALTSRRKSTTKKMRKSFFPIHISWYPFPGASNKKSKTIDDYHNNGIKVVGMLFKCRSHVGQSRDQLRVVCPTDTDFHFRWRESLFFKSENLVVGLIRVTDRGHH